MKHYYLSNGLQALGPFGLAELPQQGLLPSSLVWHEELPSWLPAMAVPEVLALLAKSPPVLLPKSPPVLQRQPPPLAAVPVPPAAVTLYPPAPWRTLPGRPWFFLGGGAVLLLLAVFAFIPGSSPSSTSTTAEATAADAVAASESAAETVRALQAELAAEKRARQRAWNREHLLEYVDAAVLPGYAVGLLGGISGGSVQLANNSGYRLENVVLGVRYITAGGGIFKTEYVSIAQLGAHQSSTLPVPACGRGVKLECFVYQLTAPGLEYSYLGG